MNRELYRSRRYVAPPGSVEYALTELGREVRRLKRAVRLALLKDWRAIRSWWA